MPEKINLNGVQLTLGEPDTHESQWIDYNDYVRQLEAAWLRLSDVEVPLNPRIVGELRRLTNLAELLDRAIAQTE